MQTQGTQGFLTGSDLREDSNPMSCVLVNYHLLGLRPPVPPFICQGG
jgi:hypothetical protein